MSETPTTSQILAELEIDPKKWENAGARDQIMVVLHWGDKHGRRFDGNEICELLKLPEDVVLTVLDGLVNSRMVRRFDQKVRNGGE